MSSLTIKDVAKRLKISTTTARALVISGSLKSHKLTDTKKSHWRVEPADLEAFIKARKKDNGRHANS